jgi:hypothetical protein
MLGLGRIAHLPFLGLDNTPSNDTKNCLSPRQGLGTQTSIFKLLTTSTIPILRPLSLIAILETTISPLPQRTLLTIN